jgi:hypothetical protein
MCVSFFTSFLFPAQFWPYVVEGGWPPFLPSSDRHIPFHVHIWKHHAVSALSISFASILFLHFQAQRIFKRNKFKRGSP